jgi:phenylacetaldehyde dehydrogenase
MKVKEGYGLFVGGAERPAASGRTFDVTTPFDGSVIARVAEGDADDVDDAVGRAGTALRGGVWRRRKARDRARILTEGVALLDARRDDLAEIETRSVGRPLREMRTQLARAPEWLEYFAAVAQTMEGEVVDMGVDHLNFVVREPLGVVGAISPWNHPLLIALKKVTSAVAAGNSVVLKPSELAPITPIELAAVLTAAGAAA